MDFQKCDKTFTVHTADGTPVEVAVRFYPPKDNRMHFNLTLGGVLAIRNASVVNGSKGLFVSMPSYKTTNAEGKDEYHEYVFPVTAVFRAELYDTITTVADLIWER